jgi:ribonuclease P protein component
MAEQPEGSEILQAAFSVPKKKHKKAVFRNLLKRRMREAYRQNFRQYLSADFLKSNRLLIVFIYTQTTLQPYKTIEADVISALQILQEKICSVP